MKIKNSDNKNGKPIINEDFRIFTNKKLRASNTMPDARIFKTFASIFITYILYEQLNSFK